MLLHSYCSTTDPEARCGGGRKGDKGLIDPVNLTLTETPEAYDSKVPGLPF